MAVYWLTFRLKEDATYSDRYDALIEQVKGIQHMWWVDASSFILFEATSSIDDIAKFIKGAIDPAKDLVLVGMPDFKDARVIGALKDQDLFTLMPFTKNA